MALTKIITDGITDDAVTEDKLANAINTAVAANTAKDLTALSASNLTSGTIPDARFPATLPAASAANLTAVPAANITGTLPAISAANLTNVPAANITGTLPAISGANLTNLPASGQARNLIINGAMQVAQYGSSFSNISTSGVYGSVDRMMMVGANLDQLQFAAKQTSDGPDGFANCFEFDVTTAESALDANDLAYIRYKIEGQDLVPLYNANGTGKNFVISFYVKSNQAGTYQLNIYKDQGPRFISKTYTISSANTWERIEIPFTGDTGTSGINNNTSVGFNIAWMLVAGTDYTSAGVQSNWGGWPGNSGFAGGHAVNVASSTNNYFRITGIQLEIGDTATDFAHETYPETLRKCQRYYWKISAGNARRVNGYKRHDGNSFWELQCPVPMRIGPSPTLLTSGTFTNFTSNFNTTQSGPHVNEWNQDTGWGLLYVSSTWSTTSASIPSWEGYAIEFSAEL